VAITAPYMHNGMFRNLKEVVNYYNHPDKFIYNSINRDTAIHALNLSDKEVNALVEFLQSLTDKRFINNKTN
jgi:cytochrome c peroxidase